MKKDCAVVVYLDNDGYCKLEFPWLYNSWRYSNADSRSDLIVFYNPLVDITDMPKESDVIYVPLNPTNDPLWHDYPRINSTYFLTTSEAEIIKDYLYTFRTDIDNFFTKNFVNFRPRLATFGITVYASRDPKVGKRISAICERLGITQYFMNSDCHFMMNSYHATEYAKTQYEIATILKREEFKEGPGDWPGWYEYIINMYSAGIAANAHFTSGYMLGGLGVLSCCDDYIGSSDYTIHAVHTMEHFSKHRWRRGEYDVLDISALDESIVANYCIKMAGKRGTIE